MWQVQVALTALEAGSRILTNFVKDELQKAVEEERWEEVRVMLKDPEIRGHIHTKRYRIASTEVDDGQVMTGGETATALHLALQRRVPLDIVKDLIAVDPSQLEYASEPNGYLPLHLAVMHDHTREDMIEYLCGYNKPAIAAPSSANTGKTPLHIACEKSRPINIIQSLHYHNPSACQLKDSSGSVPLDLIEKQIMVMPHWRIYRREVRAILGRQVDNNSNNISDPLSLKPPPSTPSTSASSSLDAEEEEFDHNKSNNNNNNSGSTQRDRRGSTTSSKTSAASWKVAQVVGVQVGWWLIRRQLKKSRSKRKRRY